MKTIYLIITGILFSFYTNEIQAQKTIEKKYGENTYIITESNWIRNKAGEEYRDRKIEKECEFFHIEDPKAAMGIVKSILKKVFTKEKLSVLSEKKVSIRLIVIYDLDAGKILDVSFSLDYAPSFEETDPVLITLRELSLFEKYMKEEYRVGISTECRETETNWGFFPILCSFPRLFATE
jgi:hypothetical protein